jgi:hypothetical protein
MSDALSLELQQAIAAAHDGKMNCLPIRLFKMILKTRMPSI